MFMCFLVRPDLMKAFTSLRTLELVCSANHPPRKNRLNTTNNDDE